MASNKNEREYRNMAEFRINEPEPEQEERKIVEGYATTFDEPYTLFTGDGWEYREVIDKNAFDNTDLSDVIMQYNHEGRVFARISNNTLDVKVDDKGLFISADLGGTELGRELYDEIRGGYTDKMSFGFTVDGETEEKEERDGEDTIYTRRVTSIRKLYDVSAVSIPANDATTISVRNLTDGVIERIRAERLEAEKLELRRRKLLAKAKLNGGHND